MSIFATKSIERIQAEQLGHGEAALKRVLGPWQLVMLGVGAIIGTGIFVLTGQAAAANAGPAIVLSMVLAGVTSVLAALCYSEFASSVPVAGSAYTYAYATLGEFVAWVIGWDLILEYALGRRNCRRGVVRQSRHAAAINWGSVSPRRSARRRDARHDSRRGSCDRRLQSAGGPDHRCRDAPADRRRQRIRDRERRDRRHQGCRGAHRDRRGRVLHSDRELAPVHSAQHRHISASTAGAACCAAPASSSSPISASTPCRRPRRKRATLSTICRGAFSGRSRVCTVLFVLVSGVMVGIVPYARCSTSRRRS